MRDPSRRARMQAICLVSGKEHFDKGPDLSSAPTCEPNDREAKTCTVKAIDAVDYASATEPIGKT